MLHWIRIKESNKQRKNTESIYRSSINNWTAHHYGFGWGNGSSGTSANYVEAKYNTGTGTHTYDIPASMVGNAYHFTLGVNCGQNCNNNTTITLACTYNSSNPP